MTLRGGVKAFPLGTVLPLLAATEKTGVLEVREGGEGGVLELARGRLTGARYEDDRGIVALGPIFAIEDGDFEFGELAATGEPDLDGDLERLLDLAATERARYLVVRDAIPHDRVHFVLSARAADRGEIRLAPAQWRALLAVDPAHDVADIAHELGLSRLGTASVLADLVHAGLIEPTDVSTPAPSGGSEAEQVAMPYARRLPPMRPLLPTVGGEPVQLLATLPEFPLETILQLIAATKKTGRLEVRGTAEGYVLGFERGRLTSAAWEDEAGELALGAAFTLASGEAQFVPMAVAPAADLEGDLDELLDRAVAARDRIAANRALIPSERMRFRLSERAAQQQPQITLTADQWRALLAVNGDRDVALIAQQLHARRLATLVLLADLVRSGLIDVVPEPEPGQEASPDDRALTWPFVERRRTPWPPPSEAPAPSVASVESPTAEAIPAEPVAAEAAPAEAAPAEAAPTEVEQPLEETPLDREPSDADDRLAALSGVFGPAEPAPPPAQWEPSVTPTEAAMADAAAKAFAESAPPLPETEPVHEEPQPEEAIDPRLAAFGAPPGETAAPEPPAWTAETPAWEPEQRRPWDPEPAAPTWEPEPAAPAWEPAEPSVSEWVDPRLAAFEPAPAAEPEALPEPEAAPTAEAPPTQPAWPEETYRRAEPTPVEPYAEPPAAPAPQKKGGLFGGLFGRKQPVAAPATTRAALARTDAGKLALFANALIDGYNSGQYGKGRVEDRMIGLLMRVDEQADPIDRPLPVAGDRVDVASVDDGAIPEEQSLPYIATLVRQVYDDAERAFGKDKARRGFREIRDRVFGKDQAALQAAPVAGRMPKV
jgi:uncharacterized protein DUF4388